MKTALILGGHGFIGHHMARRLKDEGYWVRTVDIKNFSYGDLQRDVDDYVIADLRKFDVCKNAFLSPQGKGFDEVYCYAADMGGAQYVFSTLNDAEIMHNSALININCAEMARRSESKKVFFSSSACIYAQELQTDPDKVCLTEDKAYPANPDSNYGWEKLFSERLYQAYAYNHGMNVRIARFHNVFGSCYDAHTEILTDRGFVFFSDLTMSDKVATLNQTSGTVEFHIPSAYQVFPFSGDLYTIKHKSVDLNITPNHAVYVDTRSTKTNSGIIKLMRKGYRRKKISDVADQNRIYMSHTFNWEGISIDTFTLPSVHMSDGHSMAGMNGNSKSIHMDLWLEFLGWYLSKGSCFKTPSNYTVCISQRNKKILEHLQDLLSRMGFRSTINRNSHDLIISSKQLYYYCRMLGPCAKNKGIPREFMGLEKRQLQILFHALMMGDGDKKYQNKNSFRYSSASYALATSIQEIGIKLGYCVWIGEENGSFNKKSTRIYRVHFSKRKEATLKRKNIKREDYTGKVYDVTVKNHVIFVRRNGKCVWSGNCGAWGNGREKSPAAICRKVAMANDGDSIEVWGDGKQTRSFLYIDECLEGVRRLMNSDFEGPVNIGSDEMVSINQLVEIVKDIAGKPNITINHVAGPLGVRGRSSDNTLIKKKLGWAPNYSLRKGLEKTYPWILSQIEQGLKDKGHGA